MYIVSAADVRARLGLGDDFAAKLDPTIQSYITSAQLRIESAVGTSLTAGEKSDLFYIDSSVVGGIVPNGFHRLLLSNGFLWSMPSVTVLPADSQGSAVAGAANLFSQINEERGVVYLPDAGYEKSYVLVTYSYGFDDTHAAPEWLKEVVLSAVAPLFNASEPTNGSEQAAKFYATIESHIQKIVDRYIRNPGMALTPVV